MVLIDLIYLVAPRLRTTEHLLSDLFLSSDKVGVTTLSPLPLILSNTHLAAVVFESVYSFSALVQNSGQRKSHLLCFAARSLTHPQSRNAY